MKFSKNPNRKLPWNPQFFDSKFDLFQLCQCTGTLFLFYMSFSYYGFLRILELLNLKIEDIVFDFKRTKIDFKYKIFKN